MYTIKDLENIRMTKQEAAKSVNLKDFDCSLPQSFLNDLFKKYPIAGYNLLRSTIVWSYDDNKAFGKPVSFCIEIQDILNKYLNESEA